MPSTAEQDMSGNGTAGRQRDLRAVGARVEQLMEELRAVGDPAVRGLAELMDLYFPNSAWIRMRRETFDALQRFKSRQARPTWDHALEALLKQAGEGGVGM